MTTLRSTSVLSSRRHPVLKTGLLAGVAMVAAMHGYAGDILRGGASTANAQRSSDARANAGADTANLVRTSGQDRLARTTKALMAVQAMQLKAGTVLPIVPDGLVTGGLKVATGANARWDGANLPTQKGTDVTVVQTDSTAVLHWETFNIGRKTTLNFDQSAGGENANKWIAFNRILDPSGKPSQILGSIKADGQIYVINQNGVIFSAGSQVNTRGLTVSTLPINENLIQNGLLNNPDAQFLFSTSDIAAGAKGTPAFTAPAALTVDGKRGDIVVMSGASISVPTSPSKIGGRVTLIGANVTNSGTISTPDGQTILAAGLQVGFNAHSTDDPSLRGLDVYVGDVGTYAGSVLNDGLIDAPRASVILAGKAIRQNGIIDASTSVSLNGRIDLIASYGAISNPAYDATLSGSAPFLFSKSGSLSLGQDSVTRVLPEWASLEKVAGTQLALPSIVNLMGLTIHLEKNAMIVAPGARLPTGTGAVKPESYGTALTAGVQASAGNWLVQGSLSNPIANFAYTDGQIYLDSGSFIDVTGSRDVNVSVLQNILNLELRGAEFADSPLQRDSLLRGIGITLDARRTGTYNGRSWIGTPIADASGYVGLIERTVAELTTAGGTVNLSAGQSVVMQKGSSIDVSGGWINYQGGKIQTTRLWYQGRLIDISDATPDRLYSGIYNATATNTHAKWGIAKTYSLPLAPTGAYMESSYMQGADSGSISIQAPSMALDGELTGRTVIGPRQVRDSDSSSSLPDLASLNLSFKSQDNTLLFHSPTPPSITFGTVGSQATVGPFLVDGSGSPLALPTSRIQQITISPDILGDDNFGSLTIDDPEGNIAVPKGVTVRTPVGGSLVLKGSNITVGGQIFSPGGNIALTAYNFSPFQADVLLATPGAVLPAANPGRGTVLIQSGALLSVAGTLTDDRQTTADPEVQAISPNAGSVTLEGYNTLLEKGSVVDAMGGFVVSARNSRTYGNGGSISILASQDPGITGLLGGKLNLGGTLLGYAGGTGASLSLKTTMIQVGGTTSDPDTLLLDPDYFSQGGFGSFTLTGLGKALGGEHYSPGVLIAPGTEISPVSTGLVAIVNPAGGGGIAMEQIVRPEGLRTPVSLAFRAPGVTDNFSKLVEVRGDVVVGLGALVQTEPFGSLTFAGQTVSFLGSAFAPSGAITVQGADNFPSLDPAPLTAFSTVFLGPQSILSTAGRTLLLPDAYGRRRGAVLPGGSITVAGNLIASKGALLDVSGAAGRLDLSPLEAGLIQSAQAPATSGVTTALASLRTVSTLLESNGGSITLDGGQMMVSEATLRGNPGGPTALGGSLSVSSDRFYTSSVKTSADLNLVVTQTRANNLQDLSQLGIGSVARYTDGTIAPQMGYFSIDQFTEGKFDALTLGGNVQFSGPVSIKAGTSLSVATGGVIAADALVSLTAPYVALGQPFQPPTQTALANPIFTQTNALGQQVAYNFAPTFGPGRLTVDAQFIDIGSLSFQGIGSARLSAKGGDIRGQGVFDIAGDLTLEAAQIYPTTANYFNIFAYDHGGVAGSVSVIGSGVAPLPFSAGGQLGIFASRIDQRGVLRAPYGSITLGWDGTAASAPKDLIAGASATVATTQSLTLGAGSVTSVSAFDPTTGLAVDMPYGFSLDGNSWISPAGVDISAGGLPAKSVSLAGNSITTEAGSTVDIRGGGDLFAYRWIYGNGGTQDILANSENFVIIPGYNPTVAPYAPYSTSPDALNLAQSDAGYVNSLLSVGDKVYLDGTTGVPKGAYTLLPARYAFMPGAYVVTQLPGDPIGAQVMPDGSSVVSGYYYNGLKTSRIPSAVRSRFEVAPIGVVQSRAEYELYSANTYLKQKATDLEVTLPRLPMDAGKLVLQATQNINLLGNLQAAPAPGGRVSEVDIASASNILITDSAAAAPAGYLVLNSGVLNGFQAGSLLIGGIRTAGTTGTSVSVRTGDIRVDNAGSPLTASEVILAANHSLQLTDGSEVSASGTASGGDPLLVSGDGVLLRASGDASAPVIRSNVPAASTASVTIGAGARVAGTSITIDSTGAFTLDPTAELIGSNIALNAGRISIVLDNPGALQPAPGLVLAGNALESLKGADSVALSSYSSLDIYGTGTFEGAVANLSLSMAEIRGFNTQGGTAKFLADQLTLSNAANQTPSTSNAGPTSGSLVFQADTIHLGANQLSLRQYTNVTLDAARAVIGEGTGGLHTDNDLTIMTPLLTGARSASQSISAGGTLSIVSNGGTADRSLAGLGSSLILSGQKIDASSQIYLPSGSVTLNAAQDVTVYGAIDVGGVSQSLFDVLKDTDGGAIALNSTGGNVVLKPGSLISVAATNSASAGSVSITAAQGQFIGDGQLVATGGTGGSFLLDVGQLATTSDLTHDLRAASFTRSQTIRVRTGDVLIDGVGDAAAKAQAFALSADQGKITVTGTIDASGVTGGSIQLASRGDLTLASGSLLTVHAEDFNSAGKGGSVSLEAGSSKVTNGVSSTGNGWLDLQTGSTIDLGVDSYVAGAWNTPGSSAFSGQFTGTLHLRAPQIANMTDLQVQTIGGTILGASNIQVEGYRLFDLTGTGGVITNTGATVQAGGGLIASAAVNVQESVRQNGVAFGGNSNAIKSRLFTGANSSLADSAVVSPGAEIINSAATTPVSLSLTTSGSSSFTIPATGGSIVFPAGTTGNNLITSTRAGTITSASGVVTALAVNTPTAIAAGSTLSVTGAATVAFASGTGGPVSVQLSPGTTFTTASASAVATVNSPGASISLATPGNGNLDLAAGSKILFTTGTPGTRQITSTVAGTIVTASGSTIALVANTPVTLAAGSTVTLGSAGRLSYASTGTGTGAVNGTLLAGSLTTSGIVAVAPATGDLILGTATSTGTSDWNLATYRFGPQLAPGVLTLRAAGDLVFYNTLSDGFTAVTPNAANGFSSMWLAPLKDSNLALPLNLQSYSYRLAAGADLSAANFLNTTALSQLSPNKGSVLIGKNIGQALGTGGANAQTAAVIASSSSSQNNFQVIRTGTGDISISAGRDIQLLNQFATIYTAGAKVPDATSIYSPGDFSLPAVNDGSLPSNSQGTLGAFEQIYPAQYSFAGGNIFLSAQQDIAHYTKNGTTLVADSSRQVPTNWLYRRGAVDPVTGQYGEGGFDQISDPSASTTWWIDFSNFFEGVGALGGGNVTLNAGRDVMNVDAFAPTTARSPGGTPDASKLLEQGGGDLTVQAGRDINGGMYYVERGSGTLTAGRDVTTNSTRSPSRGIISSFSTPEIFDQRTWLPTTLFVGKGGFDVSARGNILLGPTANPFLLPQGLNNGFWYKTYFSTYAPDSYVNVASLGGDIDFRLMTLLPGQTSPKPILEAWLQQENVLSTIAPTTFAANYYTWQRLAETSVAPFDTVLKLLPPHLDATAFSGDINIAGDMTLYPSQDGNLQLLADGNISGLSSLGVSTSLVGGPTGWYASTIDVSDASPLIFPGVATPFAYRSLFTSSVLTANNLNGSSSSRKLLKFLDFIDVAFQETGSTTSVIQTKQALHGSSVLHANDTDPVRIYATDGNISGVKLFSPKQSTILAENDILDVALYLQNTSLQDYSLVSAGRDIIAYDANTAARTQVAALGNRLTLGQSILAGDIQINGPGTLAVLAGRNLDLGTGSNNPDGTGVGITSVGNLRNPSLAFDGANIIAGAGVGVIPGLLDNFDPDSFLTEYTDGSKAPSSLAELPDVGDIASLSEGERQRLALQVFFLILRDAGRNFATTGDYATGYTAIDDLFQKGAGAGSIFARGRDIRTRSGGDIDILAPNGNLTLANSVIGNPLAPSGIITESGGDISVFTKQNVNLGIGRIFVLRGGNIVIWSSEGDIAAGASSKTVHSAPPTRVLIDPQSATVETDLAGLATGGGIGVLATVEGVPPGDVDLIAPQGTVDAGDAGIRATGNLSIAAAQVLNADNISVGGTTSGVPAAPAVTAPNIGGLTSAANTAGAGASAATDMAQRNSHKQDDDQPASVFSVEVLGYGGAEG